jgi:hypothetical protein
MTVYDTTALARAGAIVGTAAGSGGARRGSATSAGGDA